MLKHGRYTIFQKNFTFLEDFTYKNIEFGIMKNSQKKTN